MRRVLWLVCFATWLGVSTLSFAQDEAEDDENTEAATNESDSTEAGDAEAVEAPEGDSKAGVIPAAASGAAQVWWVGPYIEGVIVPSFLLDIFLAESPTVFNASFGATVTHRNAEDGFSWVLGLGYAGYGFDGPFRAKGDPEEDTEFLNSSLGLLLVRGMLLWSTNLTQNLAFEYGVGIELGVVLGELIRSEAFKDASGNYHACAGPNNPFGTAFYCEDTTPPGLLTNKYNEEGAHYHVKEERVPPVAAALMIPALALRYQPIDKLAIKLEASFGLMQFSFGLSAAYGLGG